MPELEPNVDIYGAYARASAVADFVELLALRRSRWSRSNVADYIGDAAWGAKLHETFLTPGDAAGVDNEEGEGLGTDAEDAAERIFSLLARRQEYLGQRYPFRLAAYSGHLELLDDAASPYLVLLAITIAHAFRINVGETRV